MNVPAHRRARRRLVRVARDREVARHEDVHGQRQGGAARATTSCRWARRSGCCSRSMAGGVLGGRRAQGLDARRVVDAVAHRRPPRRAAWTSSRWPRPARCSGPARSSCWTRPTAWSRPRRAHDASSTRTSPAASARPAARARGGPRGSSGGSRTATGASEDIPLMDDMGTNILFRAFCALADGAASVRSTPRSSTSATSTRSTSGSGRCPLNAPRPRRRVRGGRRRGGRSRPDSSRSRSTARRSPCPKGTLIIRAAEQLGHRDPALLRPPAAGAGRRVPPVLRAGRGPAQAAHLVHDAGRAGHGRARRRTPTSRSHEAQVANLEFLLLNHPLDCPICDRGGECPLQDQALAFGPGESRYVEAKRTYAQAAPAVAAGEPGPRTLRAVRAVHAVLRRDLAATGSSSCSTRGAGEQVAIAAGEDFRSPVQRQHRSRSARWAR